MHSDIGEIKTAISRFRNDTSWLKKRSRWDDDFDLYRLKPYDAGKGYYSYTTNAPRVLVNKVISLAEKADLKIRVPLDTLTEPERTTASNVERFLYGALNMNDRRMFLKGEPTTREQMCWYSGVRGGYLIRVYVYKGEDGQTVLSVDIWDIYNCAYEQGDRGLLWVAHTYKATKEYVKEVYGIDKGQDLVDMVDYWNTKKYGVIVDNEWGIELKEHGLDHCPVYKVESGDMPTTWMETYQYTSLHKGESVLANNRDIYPLFSKTISDYLTMVRRGVKTPLLITSPTGEVLIEQDIWQVEKAGIVHGRTGTEAKPLIEPSMPRDAEVLLQVISGETQRGGLPHSSWGEMAIRLSGYAINQLHQAVETSIMYVLGSVARGYEIACEELLEQYTTGKFPPVKIRGRTSRNEVFGLPKPFRLRPSALKGDWRPEIALEPSLPKDKAQDFYMANLARQGIDPLLSDETIMDTILGVRDTDLETQKKAKQWAARLPILRLYDAFLSALEEGRPDVARNILAELQQLLGQLGINLQAGAPSGLGAEIPDELTRIAGETPGAGLPTGETGFPASVLPPEALGGLSPGTKGAKMPVEGEY